MRLKEDKKKKVCRRDKQTDRTKCLHTLKMLQLINDNTMALISATVSPNGHTAPLLNRFFTAQTQIHISVTKTNHKHKFLNLWQDQVATWNVLTRAYQLQKKHNSVKLYSGSYGLIAYLLH